MDQKAEKKFQQLKNTLQALKYYQPFTIDSSTLVEKLLNDLLKTTEGFTNLKKQIDDYNKKLIQSEQQIEPLKKENHKLIKENNELHSAMIKVKEDADYKDTVWQTKYKSLEGEKMDMKFVLEQKDIKLKKIEDECQAIKAKFNTLLAKVYIPSSQKGLDSMPQEYINENISAPTNISLGKKIAVDIQKPLQDVQQDVQEQLQTNQNNIQELEANLKQSEDQTEFIKEKLNKMAEENELLLKQVQHYELQVRNRDQEITRLNSKIDIGSINTDKLSNDYMMQQQIEKVERLNQQIDFLNNENKKLEEQTKTMSTDLKKSENLRTENRNQLAQINDLQFKLEQAKQSLMNTDFRVERVKEELIKQQKIEVSTLTQQKQMLEDQLKLKEQDINEMEEKIKQTMEDNEQFRKQVQKSQQLQSAYQSDKRAFAQSLENLKSDKSQTVNMAQQLSDEIQKKNEQLSDLEAALTQQKSKVLQLQRELELTQKNQERLVKENKEANDGIHQNQKIIQELEKNNLKLSNQKTDLNTELERLIQSKTYLEEQVQKFKNDTYKMKSDFDTKNVVNDRIQALYEGAQKDIDLKMQEINTLEQLLQKSKENYVEIEHKCSDQFNQIKNLNDQIKEMEKQNLITQDLLNTKIKELRTTDNSRSESERENIELKAIKKKYEELCSKQKIQKEESSQIEVFKLKFNKEIDQLRVELQDKQNQLELLTRQLDKERKEKLQLAEKINDLSLESSQIQTSVQRFKEKEMECQKLLKDLDNFREKERKYLSDIEKYQSDIRKNEQLIINGTKNVEILKNQKEDLMKELKEYQNKLSQTQTDKQDGYTKSIQLQERVNNYELQVAELSSSLSKEQQKGYLLNQEISQLQMDNGQLRQVKAEHELQIKQLKTLSEGLDHTREELLQKLQLKHSETLGFDQEKSNMAKEISQLRNQINDLQTELSETKASLIQIDNEKDQMQNNLDDETIENSQLKNELKNMEAELQQVKEKQLMQLSKNDQGIQRLSELDHLNKENIKRINFLNQESENLKYTLQVKEKEKMDLASDLNVVTRDNKNMSDQLKQAIEQRDQAIKQLEQFNLEDRKSKQQIRVMEMEKNDIVQNYQQVCLENERINKIFNDLQLENQQLFLRIKEFEKEMAGMQGQQEHFSLKEQQMLTDIDTFQRQISFLNKKLEEALQDNQKLLQDKNQILSDFDNVRKVNDGMSQSRGDVQRSIISLETENMMLSDKLKSASRDLELLKIQLEEQKEKVSQLEIVLREERQLQHDASMQLAVVQKEKDESQQELQSFKTRYQNTASQVSNSASKLQQEKVPVQSTTINELQKTIDHLQKRIDGQIEENIGLKNEQKLLREENSKLRLNMYKFETEKNDLQKKLALDSKSEKKEQQSEENDKLDSKDFWDKKKLESEQYKQSLNDLSVSSQLLKQRVENLNKQYDNIMPNIKKD